MALDVAMIMRLVDRFTGPAKKMQQSTDNLTKSSTRLGQLGSRAYTKVAAAARTAAAVAKTVYLHAMEKAGHATGRLIRKVGQLTLATAKWAALGASAVAGFAIFNGGKGVLDVDLLESQLSAIEGSADKARTAVNAVRNMGLPFDIVELTEALIEVRKAGMEPTIDLFRAMGNQALKAKEPINEVAKAVREAATGDMGGLERFGVMATKGKGLATFTYLDKEGKRVSKSVRDSAANVKAALIGIFDSQAGGQIEAYRKSWYGLWQTMKNFGQNFMIDIGQAGILDLIKAKMETLSARLSEMAKDGTLKQWAQDISDRLEYMVEAAGRFVTETNWSQVATDLGTVASAVVDVSTAIVTAIGWAEKLANILSNVIPTIALLSGNPVLKARAEAHFETQRRGNLKDPKKVNFLNGNKGPDAAAAIGMRPMKLPKATKTSSLNQSLIQLDIRTPPGTEARAKPAKLAGNTQFALNRGKAMGAAA